MVVCQLKPMAVVDVRPYNEVLSNYLTACGPGGFGCLTQIRMEFLKPDGFHVHQRYCTVIDRTYACAIRGIPVPCPTPQDNFVPSFVRRRMDREFPRLVGQAGGNGMQDGRWQ